MAKFSGQGITLGNQFAFGDNGLVGTASQQTIPHGLGRKPDFVLVQPADPATATVTSISSDKTNIYVTVANNKAYSVLAFVI